MPSMSAGLRPASAIALLTDSHAIESVVRFDGRICGVSPVPTMQYLSVSAPIASSTFQQKQRRSWKGRTMREIRPQADSAGASAPISHVRFARTALTQLAHALLQFNDVAVGIFHPDLPAGQPLHLGRQLHTHSGRIEKGDAQ